MAKLMLFLYTQQDLKWVKSSHYVLCYIYTVWLEASADLGDREIQKTC